jgi:hypothetical protein
MPSENVQNQLGGSGLDSFLWDDPITGAATELFNPLHHNMTELQYSKAYDVSGMASIGIEYTNSTLSSDEWNASLSLQVSLDGSKWIDLDDTMFTPPLSSLVINSGETLHIDVLGLVAHFIRVVLDATGFEYAPSAGHLFALIAATEG